METIGDDLRSTPTPQVAAESACPAGSTRAEKKFSQLEALVDSIDDAIIVKDFDDTIEVWNAAAEKLYGYTREEAVGHPIAMLVSPEVLEEFEQIMERVRRGEGISSLETVRLRKDGSRVQVALTISPIMDAAGSFIGSSGVARDLSERRRMETQVLKSRARMRAILDTAVDAIISIDGRGLIQSINPATERIFGYTTADLIGQNVKILMPPPYHQEHDGYLARYKQTGEKRIIGIGREVQARRKDGTVFAIDLAVSEVEPGILFTGIIRDISERKIAEKALHESNRLAAIGSMARGIGHDINNLLNSFHLAVCLLDRCCPLSPDGVEALRMLRSTTGYLRDLARGLHLAALDAQEGRGASHTTQLMDWWPATAALLRAVSHPDIALEPSIAPGLPSVRISPHQLTQVVFNLVCNAYNAIKEPTPAGAGGGVVRVMATLKSDGHGVRVQVADNGPGMSPDVLARAFEPLFTTRAGRGGTGLGLALVKSVVTEAGGEV